MSVHIKLDTKSSIISPTSKSELKHIIKQELREQGMDADLNFIDTSEIEDMSYLFSGFNIGNIKINHWNVSKVNNMEGMF